MEGEEGEAPFVKDQLLVESKMQWRSLLGRAHSMDELALQWDLSSVYGLEIIVQDG